MIVVIIIIIIIIRLRLLSVESAFEQAMMLERSLRAMAPSQLKASDMPPA